MDSEQFGLFIDNKVNNGTKLLLLPQKFRFSFATCNPVLHPIIIRIKLAIVGMTLLKHLG